uniref:Chalcone and stilbene synthase domain protein n=1 Tax=Myxococcus fulvus TaxID=33 RepID=A0A3Q8I2C3_MYXFU|nr:chalcone and stilbene synthase domain protein [Myxococcus fulvus]
MVTKQGPSYLFGPMASGPQQVPTLLRVTSAFPEQVYSQRDLYERVFKPWYQDVPNAEEIFLRAGVEYRHVLRPPSELARRPPPSTAQRMQLWSEGALELSRRSMTSVLQGVEPASIGSLFMVSCTGYDAPSPDLRLAGELGLSRSLRRTFVGHMGCFAAFNGIKLALDALAARPDEQALVVCTELTTLHVRDEPSLEQVVSHALFGDGSAALHLANAPPGTGPQFLRGHTETLYAHANEMGWAILDDGFRMFLSPRVPDLLAEAVPDFMAHLLEPLGLRPHDIPHWIIHPGGPKIVRKVGKALGLSERALRPALEVLRTRGNCSSATVLLVLQHVLHEDRPRPGEYGVMLGFGPGLTLEGQVLRF